MDTVLSADEDNRFGLVQFNRGFKTLLHLNHYIKVNEADNYITVQKTGTKGGIIADLLPAKKDDYELRYIHINGKTIYRFVLLKAVNYDFEFYITQNDK
jgi:hypothetical protein